METEDLEPATTTSAPSFDNASGDDEAKSRKRDFGRMYVFHHVAKQASFSAAAKTLGTSRTLITKAVEGLEESFGVRLFHRTTRSFSLTEQGVKLYEHAQRMIEEFDDASTELESESSEAKGKISLQMPKLLDIPAIHGVLSMFMERHPQVVFDISNVDELGDLVTRHVDVALHAGPLENSSYHAKWVHNFTALVLGSPEYFERRGIPAHPDELSGHQVFKCRHCLRGDKWVFTHPVTKAEQAFSIGRYTTVDSERQLMYFAEAGRGITTALDVSCVKQIADGRLVPVLEEWTYQVPLHVVYVSKKSMPKGRRLFIDTLIGELPKALKVDISTPPQQGMLSKRMLS